jgi:hypothetical protein
VSAAPGLRGGSGRAAYQRARQGVGRAILLGLEVLIIADIVLTITVDQANSVIDHQVRQPPTIDEDNSRLHPRDVSVASSVNCAAHRPEPHPLSRGEPGARGLALHCLRTAVTTMALRGRFGLAGTERWAVAAMQSRYAVATLE